MMPNNNPNNPQVIQNYYNGTGNAALDWTKGAFDITSNIANMTNQWFSFYEMQKNNLAQIELMKEQISDSREKRAQRREELNRLARVRSNTNSQYTTTQQITRSY